MRKNRGTGVGKMAAVFLAALILLGLQSGACTAQAAKLKYTKLYLPAGTNEKLTISGASKVKWSIKSGSDVISLKSPRKSGVTITAKREGTAVVRAKAGSQKLTCTVTVYPEDESKCLHVSGGYDDCSLFLKKNHVLYDMKGKVICKDVLEADGSVEEFWALKVNRALYYYQKSGGGSYSSVKVLTGVKELSPGMSKFDTCYALKANGTVYRLKQKKKGGRYLNKFSTKKYMSGVEHLYTGYTWGKGNFFALKTNGTLWGWGDNSFGEMGNGTKKAVTKPKKIISDVKSFTLVDDSWGMSDHGSTCLAVRTDGTLYGWGFHYGSVAVEPIEDAVLAPVKIMEHVKFVKGEMGIVTAIDEDNVLWAWGRYVTEVKGAIAMEAPFSPLKVAEDVIYADGSIGNIYYVKSDHTLYGVWIRGDAPVEGKLKPKKMLTKVRAVDAYENLALCTDGTLWEVYRGKNEKIKKKKIMSGL